MPMNEAIRSCSLQAAQIHTVMAEPYRRCSNRSRSVPIWQRDYEVPSSSVPLVQAPQTDIIRPLQQLDFQHDDLLFPAEVSVDAEAVTEWRGDENNEGARHSDAVCTHSAYMQQIGGAHEHNKPLSLSSSEYHNSSIIRSDHPNNAEQVCYHRCNLPTYNASNHRDEAKWGVLSANTVEEQ